MATLKNTIINDTGYIKLPNGTSTQRPSSPLPGYLRYNTTEDKIEIYNGTSWNTLNINNNGISTNELLLHLDVSNPSSYPGTGTTWSDLSGNGYHHTLSSGANLTTVGGISCIDTTGAKQVADSGTTFTFGSDHTMIAWVYTSTDAQVSTWRTLWRTSLDDHPLLIQDGTDIMGYYDNNSAGFVSYGLTATGTGIAGNWAMISLVGSGGSTTTLYINEGTVNGSVGYNATGNQHNEIGNHSNAQAYGYVAAAYVYNRALTQSEISAHFSATKSTYGL
jgi:hypothetical protein